MPQPLLYKLCNLLLTAILLVSMVITSHFSVEETDHTARKPRDGGANAARPAQHRARLAPPTAAPGRPRVCLLLTSVKRKMRVNEFFFILLNISSLGAQDWSLKQRKFYD